MAQQTQRKVQAPQYKPQIRYAKSANGSSGYNRNVDRLNQGVDAYNKSLPISQAQQQAEQRAIEIAQSQAETQRQLQQAQTRAPLEKQNKIKQLLRLQEKEKLSQKQKSALNNLIQGVNKKTIYQSPYIEQVYDGSLQGVPFYKTRVVDPNTGDVRAATKDEEKEIRDAGLTYLPTKDKGKFTKYVDKLGTKALRGSTTPVDELTLLGLGFGEGVVEGVKAVYNTPKMVYNVVKSPSSVKEIPASIMQSGAEFGELLRVSPTRALGRIGGEIFVLKGTGSALRISGKLSRTAANRLKNVRFQRLESKVKFKPTKKGTPRINIKSVEQIKKARARQIAKAKRSIIDIREVKSDILANRINNLSERLADKLIQKSRLKVDGFFRNDLKNSIKDELYKKMPNNRLNPRVINKIAKRGSFKKTIFNKLKSLRRKPKKIKVSNGLKRDNKNIIRLSDIQRDARSKNIDSFTKKFADELERRGGRKLDFFQRRELESAIKDKLYSKLSSKKITPKTISRVARKQNFLVSIKNKIKSLYSRKKTKRLGRPKYITMRDIRSDALSKRVNKFSERLADKLIQKSRLKTSAFDRKDLIDSIKDKVRNRMNSKVINLKRLEKKLPQQELKKELVKSIKEPTFRIITKKSKPFKPFLEIEKKPSLPSRLKPFETEINNGRSVLINKVEKVTRKRMSMKSKSIIRMESKKINVNLQKQRQLQRQMQSLMNERRKMISQFAKAKSSANFGKIALITVQLTRNLNKIQSLGSAARSISLNLNRSRNAVANAVTNASASMSKSLSASTQTVALQNRSRSKSRTKMRSIKITEKKKQFRLPRVIEKFSTKKLSSSIQGYNIVTKRNGRLIKVSNKPLTKQDAKDYLAYTLDNNLSRTAFIIPAGRTRRVVKVPKNIQGYFARTGKKYRPYRIRQGKKRALLNGYIEKRRYALDRPGEKRRLTPQQRRVMIANLKRAKAVRMRSQPRRRVVVRRPTQKRTMSSSQRKVLLQRLAKARRVRMNNLRRRR